MPFDNRLAGELYGSAMHHGEWQPALHRLRALTRSAEVAFTVIRSADSELRVAETTGSVLTAARRAEYGRHYIRLDPKMRLFALNGPRFLFNDVEQFDDHFIAHDTFYQEYSRPVGTRHTLDYFLDSDGERDVYIAAMRSACQGPYSRRAAAQFRELGDHFLRALQCREDVERASAHARHANAALDGLNLGVVVVDASARVVLANRSARELLARGSPLRMRQSGLCCVHADIDALVSEKIARALCGCPSSLRVPGEPPLHLSAVPLPATGSLSPSDRPLVMLLMRGIPAAHSAQLGRLLQEHYGLTPAEAELAQGIAAGRTLRMLASDRRVKITTVKWQLQCVMQKLGVSRQADVVRIVTAFGGAGFE